jgi:hypothetical protein
MKNKGIIITLGVVSAITIASYVVYTMLKGKTSVGGGVAAKKTTIATAKQASKVAAQAKANPNDAALQAEYLKLGETLVTALLKTNTSAKTSTSPTGVASIIVDNRGNYIEKGDPTTLYNAQGQVIGDLDPSTGMFVNSQGDVVASSDGTPASVNQFGNIEEADGSTYALDGTPIQQNSDGSYAELDNNGNIVASYDANGEMITTAVADTGAYSEDYYDGYGASGYRSSFGKKTIHSLLKK